MKTFLLFSVMCLTSIMPNAQSECPLPKERFGGKMLTGVITKSHFSIKEGRYRYDFEYRLPSGSVIKSWVEFEVGDMKVEVGDLHVWMPANDKVRALNPNENRHIPVLIKQRGCRKIQLDFSRPAKEIPTK